MAESQNNKAPGQRLLVVTDTPEDLDQLQGQLGEAGYSLVQTWGIQGALEKIEADPPDLILLDVTAPGLEGLEVCRKLRLRAETEAVPIIVLADSEAGLEQAAVDIGADGFICRPFQRVELLSRVRTLLRMKDLHRRLAEQNRDMHEVNARLDQLNQELTSRNRELELGMQMAHRLQQALLPQRYPEVSGVSFSHKYVPADAVGGDLFQLFGLDDGRAVIFIADVSGHGIRAALITSIVRTVIDYIDMNDKTAGDVLKDFNSRFRSVLGPLTPQIYVTACIMFIDGANRVMTAASAGHPRPLLVSKKTLTAEPVMSMDEMGLAIGFSSSPEYPEARCELGTGDIVLAFTDGIFEVLNGEQKMYGIKRLQRLVAENARLVPRDIIQKIISETDEFMDAPRREDDICVVTAEVH